jgi:energy-coupling factor transporter ATP-binding protein EcfA2
MSETDEFIARIEQHTGRQGRLNGRNTRLLCPGHDDHNPSLDVAEGADGKPLVRCRSHGCTYEAICAAIGWDVPRSTSNGPVAVYIYVDANGKPVIEVGRFPKPDGGKTFLQRAAGASDWKGGIKRVPRPLPLYHLPEVIAAVADGRAIWITEGEKHADLLRSRGRVATTNPMGAPNWRREYADLLAGAARVFVLADDDTPGRKHAAQVARSLHGRVGEVKLVKLWPDGETKRDVIDFYADAATPEEADRALVAAVAKNPNYALATPPRDPAPTPPRRSKTTSAPRLTATPLTEIEMRSIKFFIRPIWQASAFTLFVGAKGSGKGTYLAWLAAQVSHAGENVLFVSSEDSASIDLKPRLVAAGAVIERCSVIKQHVRLPDDVDELRALATALGGVGLLAIDPVANHIGDRNSNSDAEVRDAIAPLNQLADELRCVLIGVRHPGKDRSRGALASILGSVAWVDTPRAVVMVAVDDEDDDVRHVQVVAGNRLRSGTARSFRIEATTVEGLAEPITKAVEHGESNKSVDDLLAATRTADGTSRTADARELILSVLEREGDQESDALDARIANETGLKARTVVNIRKQLADDGFIKPHPERDEFGSIVCWKVGRTLAGL